MNWSRREFLQATALPAVGGCLPAAAAKCGGADQSRSDLSDQPLSTVGLSQRSLQRMIQSGRLHPLDYPSFVKDKFGIDQIDVLTGLMPRVDQRLPFLEKLRVRSEQVGTDLFLVRADTFRLRSDAAQDQASELQRFHRLCDQADIIGARLLGHRFGCRRKHLGLASIPRR